MKTNIFEECRHDWKWLNWVPPDDNVTAHVYGCSLCEYGKYVYADGTETFEKNYYRRYGSNNITERE